jgi:hypothetical protein
MACGQSLRTPDPRPSPDVPQNDVPGIVSSVAPLFFPKVIQDDYQLKEYIRSDEFAGIRRQHGDLYATDALFRKALRLSWSNVYEALFISFIATLEHRKFGVRFPIVGPVLWLPLTSEFPEDFQTRVDALPSRLYPDTPSNTAGDRDKLQHFFGSAFLTYLLGSREPAERIGSFIEWGEDKFVVDGEFDERDVRTNRQGQEFGVHLLNEGTEPPSTFMHVAVAKQRCALPSGCISTRLPDSVSGLLEER